jgi:hypothetical protein
MSLIKSLKKLKLKKLQPGKIIVAAAKKVGGPIGAAATLAEKTVARVKQMSKDLGISEAEASQRLAEQGTTVLEATGPEAKSMAGQIGIAVAAGVILWLLLGKKG